METRSEVNVHGTMDQVAIDTRAPRRAYARAWVAEHILKAVKAPQSLLDRCANHRRILFHSMYNQIAHQDRQVVEVDRQADLCPEDFNARYLKTDTPVVMVGAAKDWQCVREWTLGGLCRRFADEQIRLLRSGPGETPIPGTGELTTLGEVIRRTEAGERPYVRFSSLINTNPELIDEFDEAWLVRMRGRARGYGNYGLFMGGKDTATGLHSAMAPNLFIQIAGQRRWLIYPACFAPFFQPTVKASPFFYSQVDALATDDTNVAQHLPVYDAILNPGDVLFNPAFYWHQVSNLSDTIGVGYRWTSMRQALRISPVQSLITTTATNPSVWSLRHQTDFPTVVDQKTT